AIRTNGSLECFGQNSQGWLGDGTKDSRGAPAPILEHGPWIAVQMQATPPAAIRYDGTLWSWGAGNPVPHQVGTASDWEAVSGASSEGPCLLRAGGEIHCRDIYVAGFELKQMGSEAG